MKDNAISYDLANHEQQQQQHLHHQHHHHQQQQHHQSWNHHRQQQQHQQNNNVYADQTAQNSQSHRGVVGHQQQTNSHGAQLGQFHQQQQQQQQLQTQSAHHNSAYYQQAHLYPTYQAHAHAQEHQQHSAPDHIQTPGVPSTGTNSSNINLVAANQTHHTVHHQQLPNNTQASVVNAGWSPQGVGSIAQQTHHAVVTDPSSLAYMTHPYQSHNSTVGDHHRNSNGSLSTQPIGNGPQASSYTVDSLYNSPAAAVAAYGYNNYNAAFFQSSNNGPHGQAGHPSQANMSAFWNQSQTQPQQRSAHSQAVPNSSTAQQRQHIGSEQAVNFMHDPRVYYSRPTYNQGMQNFGQTPNQPQTNVLHHRMNALSQQPQILHHQDQLNQVPQDQHVPQVHPHSSMSQQPSPPTATQQSLLSQQPIPNQSSQIGSSQTAVPHSQSVTRQGALSKLPSQLGNRQQSIDSEKTQPSATTKRQFGGDQLISAESQAKLPPQMNQQTNPIKEPASSASQNIPRNSNQTQRSSPGPLSQSSKPDTTDSTSETSRTGLAAQYQRKPQSSSYSQIQGRNTYRPPQEDQSPKGTTDRERKLSTGGEKSTSTRSSTIQDSDPIQALEDDIGSLSIGASRKTTWASIASQPAKVAQVKSLKSKIASSNSVLSSAKHLVAVSLDSSSLESKNGINPAIKSSVSAAATSIQRSSVPPPVSKVPAAASLKLDLLNEESSGPSKISWPAVNASINLTLDEPPKKEETIAPVEQNLSEKSFRKDDSYRNRDFREAPYKDHNHNHGSNPKMVNSYQPNHGSGRDNWNNRESREYRVRRNSDRKDADLDRRDDSRDSMNYRRDYKTGDRRANQFRSDERLRDRDFKRSGPPESRGDERRNEGFQGSRFGSNRFEPRENHQNNRHNDNQNAQHHHYNNVRDGNTAVNNAKIDFKLHPHLNPDNFNPQKFDLEPKDARYFIIKSYSEDDIHRSIKYSIWCSTNHGNKRLDEAYRQQQATGGPIYLFFSVNGSGHFCGMAQMTSSVDFDSSSGVWAQSKWQGEFTVKWIYVKDVPNGALRHITLENNEDKPVTNSRDTQEAPSEKGKAVLRVMHQYLHTTSLFDDFLHYERRQEEEKLKKSHLDQQHQQPINRSDERGGARFNNRPYTNHRPHNEFHNNRERPSRYAS